MVRDLKISNMFKKLLGPFVIRFSMMQQQQNWIEIFETLTMSLTIFAENNHHEYKSLCNIPLMFDKLIPNYNQTWVIL